MALLTKKFRSFLRRRIFWASKHWWTELRLHLRGKIRKFSRTKLESMSVSYSASESDQSLSELQYHSRYTAGKVDGTKSLFSKMESEDANRGGRETTAFTRYRGGCPRAIRRQQFRAKLEADSSVSRSSLLISQTRSVGAFEGLFSRDNYPSTFTSVLKHNSLSASGARRDKHFIPTRDLSETSFRSTSGQSIVEDIWSTTVLSPTNRILSSTPIKQSDLVLV